MARIVGVDLDGTIGTHPGHGLKGQVLLEAYKNMTPINHDLAKDAAVVITSRNCKRDDVTAAWLLQHHGVSIPIEAYHSEWGRKCVPSIVKHKAAAILKYGVTDYYDDEERIVKMLARKLKGVWALQDNGIYKLSLPEQK